MSGSVRHIRIEDAAPYRHVPSFEKVQGDAAAPVVKRPLLFDRSARRPVLSLGMRTPAVPVRQGRFDGHNDAA